MDLTKLRDEFIQGGVSLRELSRRYPLSYAAIQRAAQREDWKGERQRWLQQNLEAPGFQQRIDTIADKLLGQIERAAGELDLVATLTRTREKTESGERTVEQRVIERLQKVDVKELKDLVSALKTLRDLRIPKSSLDIREQEAKIRNLERQFEEQGAVEITITLDGEIGEFAR